MSWRKLSRFRSRMPSWPSLKRKLKLLSSRPEKVSRREIKRSMLRTARFRRELGFSPKLNTTTRCPSCSSTENRTMIIYKKKEKIIRKTNKRK